MLLGPAPVSQTEILDVILPGFPFRGTRGDRRIAVKRALERLGKSLSHSVYYSEPHESGRNGEFTVDVAWWRPGQGMVFAAECEWGNAGAVSEALKKLLALKAPLKVLAFNSRRAGSERQDIASREDTEAFLEVLGHLMLDFAQHVEGERYLLLELAQGEDRFQSYEFTVPGSGRLQALAAREVFQPAVLVRTAGA
jgi:hypothetical protein